MNHPPKLTKRQKIVIVSVLVTIGLIFSNTFSAIFLSYKLNLFLGYKIILGLGLLTYILSIWALWEGMSKLKAVMLFILPVFFTVSVASFYFLLPVRWLTRLPVVVIFCLSFYSLLLSQNVVNVASSRAIPLYRAASTVSFIFTVITTFFIYNVIFAFNLSFYWNGVVVAVLTFPMVLQLLWTSEMEKIGTNLIIYSVVTSWILGETAVALSFWPLMPTIWALALSSIFYVTVGVISEFLKDRLKGRLVFEYILIGFLVLLFSFITTSWTR